MSKKNIILCEGFDEVYLLGYYLYKTSNWERNSDSKIFSEYYTLPKVNPRNQMIEVYGKNSDSLAIWGVGGKDNFLEPFKFIKNINLNHPENGINQVFILQDRDNNKISDSLNIINKLLTECGIDVKLLENNNINKWQFEIEGDKYETSVVPIILPFDEEGAIETILMKAIEKSGKEEEFIVCEAKKYIEKFISSEFRLEKYLKHNREILKAKFSAIISVTNPDRSTGTFNTLLMSHDWEKKEYIVEHFKLINELL